MSLDAPVMSGSAWAVVQRPEGLAAIRQPDCGAVLWQREGAAAWFDEVAPEHLPSGRAAVAVGDVAATVTAWCAAAQTPDAAACTRFADDVAALATAFAGLMGVTTLQLRLDVVTSNMCRRFHQDAVRARLICTYRGIGTQFGPCVDGVSPEPVLTAPTGAPLIVRGLDWPGRPEGRVLHRSPPIEGSGVSRLLLVLDPVYEGDAGAP